MPQAVGAGRPERVRSSEGDPWRCDRLRPPCSPAATWPGCLGLFCCSACINLRGMTFCSIDYIHGPQEASSARMQCEWGRIESSGIGGTCGCLPCDVGQDQQQDFRARSIRLMRGGFLFDCTMSAMVDQSTLKPLSSDEADKRTLHLLLVHSACATAR